MTKSKITKNLKKGWNYIWKENTILSWILAFIIAFVIIKYIFYPLLELATGTEFPLVAVVSNSMSHKPDENNMLCGKEVSSDYKNTLEEYWKYCKDWYLENNITYEEFKEFPLNKGFNRGDIMFVVNRGLENIKIGDTILYQSSVIDYPIVHRVINIENGGDEFYFSTKGDHNQNQNFDEITISQDRVYGKVLFKIPFLGYPRIWIYDRFNH